MTPDQACQIVQSLFGSKKDFNLFKKRFQTSHILLRASQATRHARAFLPDNVAATLVAAEDILRKNFEFVSAANRDAALIATKSSQESKDNIIALAREHGYTLLFKSAWQAFPRLALVKRALEHMTSAQVSTNIYWSQGEHPGFALHYDMHDVIVIQLEGRKTWRVERGAKRYPNSWWQLPKDVEKIPGDFETFTCEAGDLLYIPAGDRHEAVADTIGSIHVTIGFRCVSARDMLTASVDHMSDHHRDLRIPVFGLVDPRTKVWEERRVQKQWKLARKQFHDAVTQVQSIMADDKESIESALSHHRAKFIENLPALPSLDVISEISDETVVGLREMAIGEVISDTASTQLYYPGGMMSGPKQIAPALHYILHHECFKPGDLPGPLTERSKILLTQQLVNHGIIEVIEASGVPAPDNQNL